MATRLRCLSDHLGRTLVPTVTSEVVGFRAVNASDGDRRTLWRASSSATQRFTYDAGAGNTRTVDSLAIARADGLSSVGATVSVQHSDDLAAWSADDLSQAMSPGVLLAPTAQDWVGEWTGSAHRGWRVSLTGSSAAPSLAELVLGQRLEVEANPLFPVSYGSARAYRGADVTLAYHGLTDAGAEALLAYLAAVSPFAPGETPVETLLGVPYGAVAHFLYDSPGTVFRRPGTPMLLHVMLLNGHELLGSDPSGPNLWDVGPCRYRQLVG